MNGLRSGWLDGSDLSARTCRSRSPGRRRVARWRSPGGLLLISLLLISLLLAPPGAPAWADDGVYTWKDAAGRVHYSNRRPEGQPVEAVELNAKPVTVRPTDRIYTWTDREGKTHYGPEPPPGVTAKELKADDSSLSTLPFEKPSAAERELLEKMRQDR